MTNRHSPYRGIAYDIEAIGCRKKALGHFLISQAGPVIVHRNEQLLEMWTVLAEGKHECKIVGRVAGRKGEDD